MDTAINTIWSVLSKGRPIADPRISRGITIEAYDATKGGQDPVLPVLVPYADQLLRAYHIEEFTGVVLRSVVRDQALTVDPVNTYEKTQLQWPAAGVRTQDLVSGLQSQFTEDTEVLRQNGTGTFDFGCVVDPAGTFRSPYGVCSFTITNGLSTPIPILPGLSLQLFGTWPLTSFMFQVFVVLPVLVDWSGILTRIGSLQIQWLDPTLKSIWVTDPVWSNRVAAVALNTVLRCRR